jgi:16S rRNA (adenine1518-N6/adenine1519-N6)-dimethyltransferase
VFRHMVLGTFCTVKLMPDASVGALLRKYELKAKKKFGQNFLVSPKYLEVMADVLGLSKNDMVLEIGPGLGTLTTRLAERAGHVLAVEIDTDFIPVLDEVLEEYDNVDVLYEDFLDLELEEVLNRRPGNWKVASNLPYYVATPILTGLLECNMYIHEIAVMLQKEVAGRIVASPGGKEYGLLSVIAQYYADVRLVAQVPAGAFYPMPDVDSAIVYLQVSQKPRVHVEDETMFFSVVRGAFAARRKTLLNSLAVYRELGLGKDQILAVLEELGIDPSRRGETLSLNEFAELSNGLVKMGKVETFSG